MSKSWYDTFQLSHCRFGRKPLMVATGLGIAFSYLLWVLSSNFAIFVLARIIGGVSKGNVSLSTAIVTDVTTPATRGKGMALIGVAFSLGFLFGPMIGERNVLHHVF